MPLRFKNIVTNFVVQYSQDKESLIKWHHKFYEEFLNFISKPNVQVTEQYCRFFLINALKMLPPQFFIVLQFGDYEQNFIQFYNEDENIVLDIPITNSNSYKGMENNIRKILNSFGISEYPYESIATNKWTDHYAVSLNNDNVPIMNYVINFGDDAPKATKFAEDIAKRILKRDRFIIDYFDASRLIIKETVGK